MTEYLGIFSSRKKKEELYVNNANFSDLQINNKYSISFDNNYYSCSIDRECNFNAIHVDNHKCAYWKTDTLMQGLEVVGNYSVYVQTYAYTDKEKCFTITQLINYLLQKTEGGFYFGNIIGGSSEILLRINGKIYLNTDYPEYHLLKFDEIEHVDYLVGCQH